LFLLLFICGCLQGYAKEFRSAWDADLINLKLEHVEIRAKSVTASWNEISSKLLLRSILCYRPVRPDQRDSPPFEFVRERTTVKELFDALVAAYPEYTYTQDAATGIVWFHPKDLPYTNILDQPVHIFSSATGVPMQTGVLEKIAALESPQKISVKRWGTAFENTFNYPVDLPSGIFSVREILNMCCVANPKKTFAVGPSLVTAINLGSDKAKAAPPAGILHFWKIHIGNLEKGVPTDDDIINALSSSNPRLRWAGRAYLEAVIWQHPTEELVMRAKSGEKALWTAIGVKSILVRTEKAIALAAVQRMRTEFNRSILESNPGLAFLVAMEISEATGDPKPIEMAARHRLSDSEFAGIADDFERIARKSKTVREKLLGLDIQLPGYSKERLLRLGNPNIFDDSRGRN